VLEKHLIEGALALSLAIWIVKLLIIEGDGLVRLVRRLRDKDKL